MFCKWGSYEWGEGWKPLPIYRTASGVSVTADHELNILVVLARRDSVSENACENIRGYDQATLWKDKPYASTIHRTKNVLRWIGARGQYDLALGEGVAGDVTRALEQARTEDGLLEDALTVLVNTYRGPDSDHLKSLADEFRAQSP